jgi:hypothetical protein
MACPHTTGVIAQLFEKNLRVSDLEEALSCASSINQLVFDPMDTISRNLLLQTPTLESVAECDLGFGCDSDCSSHGVCLPVHKDSSDIKCHCMDSYYGESCSEEIPSTCDQSEANINVRMFDAYGDGWTFTSFAITDSVTGDVVGNAMDSLCYGNQAHRSYCLEIGQCYSFEVSRGYFPSEVAWNMCGASGGAPYRGNFCVTDGAAHVDLFNHLCLSFL